MKRDNLVALMGSFLLAIVILLVGASEERRGGSTDLELNGVPVRAATPLPVQVTGASSASSDVNNAKWGGATLAAGLGAVAAQPYASIRALDDAVIRGDDGTTYSAIATRASGTSQVASLNRLLTDSGSRVWDGAAWQPWNSQVETAATSGSHAGVLEARATGFYGSVKGRRYACKSPNITGVAAATSLTTTTPTFLMVAGATKEIVVRRVTVSMPLKGTSTTFRALIKTDTANRFSSGGTARAPGTMNQGNTVATGLAQNLETPTATAESTVVDVSTKSGAVADGATIEFLFDDGLIVANSGSFLLYVVTATAGATVDYVIEFEEANVQ